MNKLRCRFQLKNGLNVHFKVTRDGKNVHFTYKRNKLFISCNEQAKKHQFQLKKGLTVHFKRTMMAKMSISLRKEQGFYFMQWIGLQRWFYCCEHLKYVWNVHCVVTNHRRDHHSTGTTGNERFPNCHEQITFSSCFNIEFFLHVNKGFSFLSVDSMCYKSEEYRF